MPKVRGIVTETISITKSVEIDIFDDQNADEIKNIILSAAYKETILDEEQSHGWEPIETHDIVVEIVNCS